MIVTIANRQVHISDSQFDALETLALVNNGGFASVLGYKPTTGYVTPPTVNIQFISKVSTEKLYDRKLKALRGLAFTDLTITDPKLKALREDEQHAQFHACVGAMIASMLKTKDGDRSDAHRQAHDTFYVTHSTGVKCHLVTEKNDAGETVLVTEKDGLPIVASIMLSILEIGRKVIVEGVYKKVNSGEKVLMDKAIMKALGNRSLEMKTLSLKPDNHTSVKIGGEILDAALHASIAEFV
jgi:hypothetical protein